MTPIETTRLEDLLLKFMHEVNANYLNIKVSIGSSSIFQIQCGDLPLGEHKDQLRLFALRTTETDSLNTALKVLNPSKYKRKKTK